LKKWDEHVLQRHNKSDISIHRLAMLADLGITCDDKSIKPVINKILKSFNKKEFSPTITLAVLEILKRIDYLKFV
jgi:anaerobic ribonucleoside-triphosphate reductase